LRQVAPARSGDKGNTANVGLIALDPGDYDLLRRQVTAARVKRHFRRMVGRVERFELRTNASTFCKRFDGGGTVSSRPMRKARCTPRRCCGWRSRYPMPWPAGRERARNYSPGA
jgi:hypothetical protein